MKWKKQFFFFFSFIVCVADRRKVTQMFPAAKIPPAPLADILPHISQGGRVFPIFLYGLCL